MEGATQGARVGVGAVARPGLVMEARGSEMGSPGRPQWARDLPHAK